MRAPTYAEATSTLALFIALGGVSWAAVTLPKNSVSSATIRDAQVRTADVAPGSITAAKLSKDLRGQLGVTVAGKDGNGGAAGANGSNGADGKSGATGPQGPAGAAGPAGRDGAAVVARANFGSYTVANVNWFKAGELTWTQPARAIDDIRGLYTSNVIGCANTGGGAAYRLVVDGVEVSQDYGNLAPDTETQYDPDPVLASPYSTQHPDTDRASSGPSCRSSAVTSRRRTSSRCTSGAAGATAGQRSAISRCS